MGLFFLLGLSTLVFGAFVFYMTYELDNLDGRTVLVGNVLDSKDQPLEGVHIICEDRETVTDWNGEWILNGIPEGLVTLEFYKPGYVVYTLKWLAYPMDDFDDIKESPNNISYSFKEGGSSDLQLKREMELIEIDDYQNGTLTLKFERDGSEVLNVTELFISNGQDPVLSVPVTGIDPTLEVAGDGSFLVGFVEDGPFLTGFHPAGFEIDITQELLTLSISGNDVEWGGGIGSIVVEISYPDPTGQVRAVLINNLTSEIIDYSTTNDPSTITFTTIPGVYNLELTGREIRDTQLGSIIINDSKQRVLDTTLKEGDVDDELDLSIKGNYIVSVAYLGIALVMFFGAIYLKRGGSWAVLLILAFVGFLSRGLIDLYIININQLLAIALIVVLFSIRSEHNRKRQRLLDRRYNRGS
jgi:hypothetical protein